MRIFDGTKYRDATDEEIAAIRAEALGVLTQPMSVEDVLRMLIPLQINSIQTDDSTALRMRQFYPVWADGETYSLDFKVQRAGKLWKAIQAHTSMAGWEPENAASLWTQINETHEGTVDDPIPYGGTWHWKMERTTARAESSTSARGTRGILSMQPCLIWWGCMWRWLSEF